MATTAESLNFSNSEESHFRVRVHMEEVRSTDELADGTTGASWRGRPVYGSTDSVQAAVTPALHVRKPEHVPHHTPTQSSKRKFVEGWIKEPVNEDGLVRCSVVVGGSDVDITLPASAFQFHIKYGAPFRFSMEDVGGYSTPRAVAVEPPRMSADDHELYELLTQTA